MKEDRKGGRLEKEDNKEPNLFGKKKIIIKHKEKTTMTSLMKAEVTK